MGNNIAIEQVQDKNVRRLAAPRAIYTKAKMIFGIQLFLSGPVVMVLSFLSIYNTTFVSATNTYNVILSFLGVWFFSRNISKYKEMGAIVQEEFDCGVFRMPWNRVIVSERLTPEQINEWSKKIVEYNREKNKVLKWYKDFPDVFPYHVARIVAQKYNTNWDVDLRNSFSNFLNIVSCLFIVAILFMSSINNMAVSGLFQILLPVLPMTILLVSFSGDNKKAIKNLSILKNKLDEVWGDILYSRKNAEELDYAARSIQDGIYLHRLGSPLIFDWFYNLKRKGQQENADYLVDQLAKEYISSLSMKHK
jgi:hypothetical protein